MNNASKRRAIALIFMLWPVAPFRLKVWAFMNDPDDGGPELPYEDVQ